METPSTAPVSPPQAHEVYLQRKREKARRARGTARAMAWGITTVLFASVLGGAVVFRNEVVRYWPEASTAFAAIGLKVNPFGLLPEDVQPFRTFEGTLPILNVTGNARNFTRVSQPAPLVRIGLIDERGREISTFTTAFSVETIPAGETASFTAIIREPPSEAFTLDVSFTEPDGSGEGERASTGVEAETGPDTTGDSLADADTGTGTESNPQ